MENLPSGAETYSCDRADMMLWGRNVASDSGSAPGIEVEVVQCESRGETGKRGLSIEACLSCVELQMEMADADVIQ